MNRIFLFSGPPAAGKTTLCEALQPHLALAAHIPVDDIRQWVVSGMADSVPWTDESERQFQVAEEAMAGVARAYYHNGFDVLVDHCRNLPRLDRLVATELVGLPVVKVCLLPSLEENLARNEKRTNKPFGPEYLFETIQSMNGSVRENLGEGWLVIDNTSLTVVETVEMVLNHPPTKANPREG